MKKTISLFLSLAFLTVTFTSCSNNEAISPSNTSDSSMSENGSITERNSTDLTEYYQKILSLKKDGYKDMSLAEFKELYIDVIAPDEGISDYLDLISEEIANDTISYPLAEEELEFISLTFTATQSEFIVQHNKNMDSTFDGLPSYQVEISQEREESFSFECIYLINYDIVDESALTVGERDQLISTIIEETTAFVDSQSIADLVDGEKASLTEFNVIAAQHSNSNIIFTVEIWSYDTSN